MNIIHKLSELINSGHARSIRAKKNILASLFLKGISILVNLAYVPLLINSLGQEEYGIWLVLSSFISWMSFFDIGIANGLRNKLGEALATKDYPLAQSYVSTTYAVISLIFVPLAVVTLFFSGFINWQHVFNSEHVNEHVLESLSSIAISFFALRFVVQIISVVLLADQRPAYSNLITVIINIIGLIVIIILKKLSMATLFFVGTIISVLPFVVFIFFTVFLFRTTYRHIRPTLKSVNFKYARNLFGLGIYFFIIQVSGLVIFSSTNLIITQFFSPVDVTNYNIAFKYFNIITMFFGIILTPLWSAITEAFTIKDFPWIKSTILKFNKIALLLTVVSVVMLVFSNDIYKLWVGQQINIPFSLSLVICIQIIIGLFWSPYIAFLNGTGRIRLVSYLVIIQCLLYVPLIFLLVKLFRLNVAAIIIATIIAEIPIRIIQPIQYFKIINKKATGIWNK